MRRRRVRREIHHVRHLAGFFERLDDAHSLGRDCFLCLIGRCADVMRPVDIRFVRDWIFKVCDRRSRLDRKHIEARPNSLRMNRLDQDILINDIAARSVDEVGAVVHRRKERFVDEHLRVGL